MKTLFMMISFCFMSVTFAGQSKTPCVSMNGDREKIINESGSHKQPRPATAIRR